MFRLLRDSGPQRSFLDQHERDERCGEAGEDDKECAAEDQRRFGAAERPPVPGAMALVTVSTMAPSSATIMVAHRLRAKFIVPTAMPS